MAAKATNLTTGETREVSEEEFMEAMKYGTARVIQTKAGSSKILDSDNPEFGQSFAESIVNSVNIFADRQTIKAFMFRAVDKMCKPSDEKERSDSNETDTNIEGYSLMIDQIDSPYMFICRKTDEETELNGYIRDEKRTIGDPVITEEVRAIDGKAQVSLQDCTERQNLLYMLAFCEMRDFLIETGQWEKLINSEKNNSGVIIKARDHGADATAQIVFGYERPDLPCLLFGGMFSDSVDEAIMMRPYVDEYLGNVVNNQSSTSQGAEKNTLKAHSSKTATQFQSGNHHKETETQAKNNLEDDIINFLKSDKVAGYGSFPMIRDLLPERYSYSASQIADCLEDLVEKGILLKRKVKYLDDEYYVLADYLSHFEDSIKARVVKHNEEVDKSIEYYQRDIQYEQKIINDNKFAILGKGALMRKNAEQRITELNTAISDAKKKKWDINDL